MLALDLLPSLLLLLQFVLPHLLFCFPATEAFAKACPATVHVDGTARPQIVREADNPSLHALLSAVGEATGVPVLVNTSFNMHEEPLVCSPSDAIRAWQQAELDALWLGEQLLIR